MTTWLRRLLGLHRHDHDSDQERAAALEHERRQADAERRIQAVEAQARVVARR